MLPVSDRTALVDSDGTEISYAELGERVSLAQSQLTATSGGHRRLVAIEATNRATTVICYLAALRARCPVLLLGEDGANERGAIGSAFSPDILLASGDEEWRRAESFGEPRTLHPDLAVLLSTSGSTGSPKLVRLSHANIVANASAIAAYLDIGHDDRAITNLPLHYSYGLSILNSHLLAGGATILTDLSVADPDFWRLVDDRCVTAIGGVPYTYELLEQLSFRDRPPPASLRTMTQAGGRLGSDLVKSYGRYARENGLRFFVMYGQTEATARMAYLPPDLAETNSEMIGKPIPGGRFSIIDEQGKDLPPGKAGELVYHGPNVMMGYARSPGDLEEGAGPTRLETGDIGVEESGLYRIVGRKSRFAKIAGQRVGFADCERILDDNGVSAIVTGDDEMLVIAVLDGSSPNDARELIAEECHLPISLVGASTFEKVPRLSSGKVDYREIQGIVRSESASVSQPSEEDIASVMAFALGKGRPSVSDSFSSLGGDSLSYVAASLGIERLLGRLPDRWEHMTVGELQAQVDATHTGAAKSSRTFSADIPIRVFALLLVITGHATPDQTEFLRGGSAILFALGGYSLARFQRRWLLQGRGSAAVSGIFQRMIIPYFLLMVPMLFVAKGIDRGPGWFVLLSTYTIDNRGPLFAFWFIEAIFHSLLIMAALSMFRPVRQFASARPFGSGLALVALSMLLFLAVPLVWTDPHENPLSVDAWFYAYAIGWTLYLADGPWQRIMVICMGAAIAWYDFGLESSRPLWLLIALTGLAFLPSLRLTPVIGGIFGAISSAAYFIYLTHVLVVHIVRFMWQPDWPPVAIIAFIILVSTCSGLIGQRLWSDFLHIWAGRVRPRFVRSAN